MFVAAVWGYGYYHEQTHGSLAVTLYDPKLARAKSDDKYGAVRVIHPLVGDCVGEELGATTALDGWQRWQAYFQQQSTWLMSWVRQTRYFEACAARRIPISIRESGDDWWLWWVPLPHIGGKPYRYFSLFVTVDRANCAGAQ